MTGDELLTLLAALGHRQRLRIVAELRRGRVHVSELARRLGLSRPLTYMHLDRLEAAGLVVGHLELSADGKAMKFIELAPFAITLDADLVAEAMRESAATEPPESPEPTDAEDP